MGVNTERRLDKEEGDEEAAKAVEEDAAAAAAAAAALARVPSGPHFWGLPALRCDIALALMDVERWSCCDNEHGQ
jgi:hypothetical protein